MPVLWIIFILLVSSVFYAITTETQRITDSDDDALASSLLVYRNHLGEYAWQNPGKTGAVSDASLSLPAWYTRPVSIGGYIQSGRAYTYLGNASTGVLAALYEKTEGTAAIGTKINGQLVSHGTTIMTLPAVIPDKAVVILY